MHFTNPYLAPDGSFPGPVHKTHVTLNEADWSLLKKLRLNTGTITTTLSILVHRLCHELRSRQLEPLTDTDKFEFLVSNLTITLPTAMVSGNPVGGPNGGPASPSNTGATSLLRGGDTQPPHESSGATRTLPKRARAKVG